MKPSNARDDIPSVFIVRLTIVYILYVFPTQKCSLNRVLSKEALIVSAGGLVLMDSTWNPSQRVTDRLCYIRVRVLNWIHICTQSKYLQVSRPTLQTSFSLPIKVKIHENLRRFLVGRSTRFSVLIPCTTKIVHDCCNSYVGEYRL